MCINNTAGGATLVLSLLLALSLSQSFVIPLTAAKRYHHASQSASCVRVIGLAAATDSAGSDEGAPTEEKVDEQDDGQARSPAGLTLEGVYKRLKLEAQGLNDGAVGLDSKDTDYGVS